MIPAQVSDTLGVLLKYQDDIAKIEGAKAQALIEEARAELRGWRAAHPGGGAFMAYDFKLSCTLPAAPEAVYDAWLDSAGHSAMTGAPPRSAKRVGDAYTAWDGYITGKTLELVREAHRPGRTSEFGGRPISSSTSSRRRRGRGQR